MAKRMPFLDSIRFIACTWVFINHFIDDLFPLYFAFWKMKPFSYVLSGYHVKVGVAAFAVILGYLAAKSGTNKNRSFLRYTVDRYSYFFVAGLLANTIILAFVLFTPEYMHILNVRADGTSIGSALLEIFRNSVLLDAEIYETFWFIKPFFYASIICFVLGRFEVGLIPVVVLDFIFYTTGQGWIAICLLGVLLFRITEDGIYKSALSNRSVKIGMLVLSIALIKLLPEESALTYLVDGISNLLFLLVMFNSDLLQKLFRWSGIKTITGKYMAFLILHRQVLHVLASLLNRRYEGILNTHAGFFGVMLLCYVVTILLCFPMDWLLNTLHKFICKVLTYIPFEKIEGKIQA